MSFVQIQSLKRCVQEFLVDYRCFKPLYHINYWMVLLVNIG